MSDAVETTESNETPEWLAKLTLPSFWTSLWIFIIFIVLKPVTKETHAQIFGKPLIEGKGGINEVISNPSLIFILLLLIGQMNRISYSKNPPLPTKPGGGQVFMNWFIINIKLVVLTFLFTFYIIQVVSNNTHNTVIPLKHKGLYSLMFIFIMQSILLNHMFNSTCRNKTESSTESDSGNFECDNLQNSKGYLIHESGKDLWAPLSMMFMTSILLIIILGLLKGEGDITNIVQRMFGMVNESSTAVKGVIILPQITLFIILLVYLSGPYFRSFNSDENKKTGIWKAPWRGIYCRYKKCERNDGKTTGRITTQTTQSLTSGGSESLNN